MSLPMLTKVGWGASVVKSPHLRRLGSDGSDQMARPPASPPVSPAGGHAEGHARKMRGEPPPDKRKLMAKTVSPRCPKRCPRRCRRWPKKPLSSWMPIRSPGSAGSPGGRGSCTRTSPSPFTALPSCSIQRARTSSVSGEVRSPPTTSTSSTSSGGLNQCKPAKRFRPPQRASKRGQGKRGRVRRQNRAG